MDADAHLPTVAAVPASITLAAGDSALTVVPALGGKLSSLRLAGREWLWTSDVITRAAPGEADSADDASYVRTADSGGYDECFPTVGPCTLPADLPAWAGLRLPDHGELWSRQPDVTVEHDDGGGGTVTVAWRGSRMPYRFRRATLLRADGAVEMRYDVANDADVPIPFIWSAHPLLPLTDHTRLRLPEGARVRLDAAHGIVFDGALDGAVNVGRWPLLAVDGAPTSFVHPAAARGGYACKLVLDLEPGPLVASVEEADATLSVAMDGAGVPNFGVWINDRGWSGVPGAAPYRNLAFEPCIGAPDSLARALGSDWRSAAWLEPGAVRRWTLVWSAARRSEIHDRHR